MYVLDPQIHSCAVEGTEVQNKKRAKYCNPVVERFALDFAREVELKALDRIKADPSTMTEQHHWLFRSHRERGLPSPFETLTVNQPSAVKVSAVAINWRGGIDLASMDVLRELKFSRSHITLTLLRLLTYNWSVWNTFLNDPRTKA